MACCRRIEEFSAADMPDQVLSEIFLRLPVDCLFRFKCVSRRWHCLISDPSFGRSYTSRKTEKNKNSLPWTFLLCCKVRNWNEIRAYQMGHDAAIKLCHSDDYKFPRLDLNFFKERIATESVRVLACDRGLVLCCTTQDWQASYYVCNPLTMHWVALPRRPKLHKWINIGFVVDAEDNEFHVVRIAVLSGSSTFLESEIFSSKIGKWIKRKLLCHCPVWLSISHWQAVPHRGILYWRGYNNKIVAYDPKSDSDKCHLFDMPKDRDRDGEGVLGVCRDSLHYFEVHRLSQGRGLSVWVLKNHKVGEWDLKYRISVAEICLAHPQANIAVQSSWCFLHPVVFHPLNSDIIYLVCNNTLVLCNLRAVRLEPVRLDIYPLDYHDLGTVSPFVLCPWPTPVSNYIVGKLS